MYVIFSRPSKKLGEKRTVYTMLIRMESRRHREESVPAWMNIIIEWSKPGKCISSVDIRSIAVLHQRLTATSARDCSRYRRHAMLICAERFKMVTAAIDIIRLARWKSGYMH